MGAFEPSNGEHFVAPHPVPEEYYGALSEEEISTVRHALELNKVKLRPIASYNHAAGQQQTFQMAVEAVSSTDTLTAILAKPFVLRDSTHRVYVSASAMKYIDGTYRDTTLSDILHFVLSHNSAIVTTNYSGVKWDIHHDGASTLTGTNTFLPVAGQYTVNGTVQSLKRGRIRTDIFFAYNNGAPLEASIAGWCYRKSKATEAILGYAFKLHKGRIVVPATVAILESICHEGGAGKQVRSGTQRTSYPADGRMKARAVAFTDNGVVLEMQGGEGLYVAYGNEDMDHPTMISFADDHEYTELIAIDEIKQEARSILDRAGILGEGGPSLRSQSGDEGHHRAALIIIIAGFCVCSCIALYASRAALRRRKTKVAVRVKRTESSFGTNSTPDRNKRTLRRAHRRSPHHTSKTIELTTKDKEDLVSNEQGQDNRRVDAQTVYREGVTLLQSKRFVDALVVFESFVASNQEESPGAWYGKAIALIGLKRFPEARAACKEAERLGHGKARALLEKLNTLSVRH